MNTARSGGAEQSPRPGDTHRSKDPIPSKTAPHQKRSGSVPRKAMGFKYGLSVSDTVKLGSKKNS